MQQSSRSMRRRSGWQLSSRSFKKTIKQSKQKQKNKVGIHLSKVYIRTRCLYTICFQLCFKLCAYFPKFSNISKYLQNTTNASVSPSHWASSKLPSIFGGTCFLNKHLPSNTFISTHNISSHGNGWKYSCDNSIRRCDC